MNKVKKLDIVLSFVNAIDIMNPILKHHHRRVAIISYYIGKQVGMKDHEMVDLILAALMHDIGALTVKDQEELMKLDVSNPEPHERLGALMLSAFSPFERIANIIRYHHVNFEKNRENEEIYEESYILHLADRIDILLKADAPSINQRTHVIEVIETLSGSLFKREVVDAFLAISKKEQFWFEIDDLPIGFLFEKLTHLDLDMDLSDEALEGLVYTLSRIVDYKLKCTISHSARVALVAGKLASYLGLDEERAQKVRLAGYLHDFGKIAIPTEILMKKGKLDEEEFNIIKSHPYYTFQILNNIKALGDIIKWASYHHEKIDQKGYPFKPEISEIDMELEILIYADIFSALLEDRPYRRAMTLEEALAQVPKEHKFRYGDVLLAQMQINGIEIYEEIRSLQTRLTEEYDKELPESGVE